MSQLVLTKKLVFLGVPDTNTYNISPDSVRYKYASIAYRDKEEEGDIGYGPMELDNRYDRSLGIYYWDQDTNRRKPLVMEVGVGYMSLYYGNDGNSLNDKWTIIPEYAGIPISAEALHKQKCRLFHPVTIDVYQTKNYDNPYCRRVINRECTNDKCPKNVQVTKSSKHSLNKYAAFRHTYENAEEGGNKTFTITGLKNGVSLQKLTPPIWDVTEAVVFLTKCDEPLLVYVDSNDKNAMKWYKNKGGNNWEVEDRLKDKNPDIASKDDLERVLDEITENLRPKCPGEDAEVRPVPPPPLALQVEGYPIPSVSIDPFTAVQGTPVVEKVEDPQLSHLTDVQGFPIDPIVAHGSGILVDFDVYNTMGETTYEYASAVEEWDDTPTVIFDTDEIYETVPHQDSANIYVQTDTKSTTGGDSEGGKQVAPEPSQVQRTVDKPPETQRNSPDQGTTQVEDAHSVVGEVRARPATSLSGTEDITPKPPIQSQSAARRASVPTQGTPLDPPGKLTPNQDIIKTTISVTTGVLGTSALACFAGFKLYKNFKGDPWVRQI